MNSKEAKDHVFQLIDMGIQYNYLLPNDGKMLKSIVETSKNSKEARKRTIDYLKSVNFPSSMIDSYFDKKYGGYLDWIKYTNGK